MIGLSTTIEPQPYRPVAPRNAKHSLFVVRQWDEEASHDAPVYDLRQNKRIKIPAERCFAIIRWRNGDRYYGCIDCLPQWLQPPVDTDAWAVEAIKYIARAAKAGTYRWMAL